MAKSESTKIEFGYFHDYESEQFAFYRIPKVLFTDEYFRNLSSDAKVLYGLMLDRMALSIRHQWFDEEGKVYIIFTVEQVIQYMNCGRDKAMKTLAELDTKKGIGLIERVKQGFGKPDIIYVKNFILRTSKDVKNNDESEESIQQNREVEEVDLSESEKSTYRGRKNRLQGVGKTDFKRSENTTYRGRKIRTTEELLAERTGINVNTIRKYEIGIRKPKVEQLKKIADGLEISVIEFLDIEIENEADLIAMLKKISPFFKWDGLLHVLVGEKFL